MRLSILPFALAGFCLLPLASVQAQDCPDQSQAGLDQCAGIAYKKTDGRLNAIYRQIVARLTDDADTKARLVTAQKAWITFRDAECKFLAANAEGGSIYPMLITQCLDGLAQKRILELEPLLTCEEGDMSCPVPSAP